MTHRELMRRLTAKELAYWQAYYAVEPFGEQRDDMRAAMLACVVARVAGNRNARTQDFMLFAERGKVRQSYESMHAQAKLLTSWFNGTRHDRTSQGTAGA
jgi:hypothetical protein